MKISKSVIFSFIAMMFSLALTNFSSRSDWMPDVFVNIFGFLSGACAGLCIFFAIRSACIMSKEKKERNDEK